MRLSAQGASGCMIATGSSSASGPWAIADFACLGLSRKTQDLVHSGMINWLGDRDIAEGIRDQKLYHHIPSVNFECHFLFLVTFKTITLPSLSPNAVFVISVDKQFMSLEAAATLGLFAYLQVLEESIINELCLNYNFYYGTGDINQICSLLTITTAVNSRPVSSPAKSLSCDTPLSGGNTTWAT